MSEADFNWKRAYNIIFQELREEKKKVKKLRLSLQELHNACSVDKGKQIDIGPMFEPSEQSVLNARKVLLETNNGY